MRKFLFVLSAIAAIAMCQGCFTAKKHNVSITAAYPFEGRYGHTESIVVNGERAAVRDGDSLWLLSNTTLYNLLTSVSDDPEKIVFKGSSAKFGSNNLKQFGAKCEFDDEQYVWDSWSIATNFPAK